MYFSIYFNVTFVIECHIVIDFIFLVVANTVDFLCHLLLVEARRSHHSGEADTWCQRLCIDDETCPSDLLSLLGGFVTENCGRGRCN